MKKRLGILAILVCIGFSCPVFAQNAGDEDGPEAIGDNAPIDDYVPLFFIGAVALSFFIINKKPFTARQ